MEPKQSNRAWLAQFLKASSAPLGNRDLAAIPEVAERFRTSKTANNKSAGALANALSISLADLARAKNFGIKRVKTAEGFKYYGTNLEFDFDALKAQTAEKVADAKAANESSRRRTGTTRVHWTPDEFESVTLALVEVLVRDHDRIAGHERLMMGPAIREAQQKALPESRQRLALPPSHFADMVKRARRLASDRLNTIATPAAPAPIETPAPMPATIATAQPLQFAPGAPPSPLSAIIESLVNTAITAITDNVTQRVNDQLTYAMSTALMRIETRLAANGHGDNGHAPAEPAPMETPNLQKRRVLIVGPLPAQQNMLRHEFEKCFDLRFAEKRESSSKMRALAAGSDYVIAWLDFLPHAMTDLIKKANPVAYEQFRGGMTALRDRLTQIYVNGQTH